MTHITNKLLDSQWGSRNTEVVCVCCWSLVVFLSTSSLSRLTGGWSRVHTSVEEKTGHALALVQMWQKFTCKRVKKKQAVVHGVWPDRRPVWMEETAGWRPRWRLPEQLHCNARCTDPLWNYSSHDAPWRCGCNAARGTSSALGFGSEAEVPGPRCSLPGGSCGCQVRRCRWPTGLPVPDAAGTAPPRWGPAGPTGRRCSGWWGAGSRSLSASARPGPRREAGRSGGGAWPWSEPSSSASPSRSRSVSVCCGFLAPGPTSGRDPTGSEATIRGSENIQTWPSLGWTAPAAGQTETGWSP